MLRGDNIRVLKDKALVSVGGRFSEIAIAFVFRTLSCCWEHSNLKPCVCLSPFCLWCFRYWRMHKYVMYTEHYPVVDLAWQYFYSRVVRKCAYNWSPHHPNIHHRALKFGPTGGMWRDASFNRPQVLYTMNYDDDLCVCRHIEPLFLRFWTYTAFHFRADTSSVTARYDGDHYSWAETTGVEMLIVVGRVQHFVSLPWYNVLLIRYPTNAHPQRLSKSRKHCVRVKPVYPPNLPTQSQQLQRGQCCALGLIL